MTSGAGSINLAWQEACHIQVKVVCPDVEIQNRWRCARPRTVLLSLREKLFVMSPAIRDIYPFCSLLYNLRLGEICHRS